MSLISIYKSLSNETRVRILHLLSTGPLCVCHLQTVLGMPQVMISKHLGYLKTHRMVDVRREANWMIYSLPARPSAELKANLACLQSCVAGEAVYRSDKTKLERLRKSLPDFSPTCWRPTSAANKGAGCCQ